MASSLVTRLFLSVRSMWNPWTGDFGSLRGEATDLVSSREGGTGLSGNAK